MSATAWAKPAIAKHQRWPGGIEAKVTTYLAQLRDQQPIKLICGINGCTHTTLGRYADARTKLEMHRQDMHPGWVKPKVRR
jgi:hypothetical protein